MPFLSSCPRRWGLRCCFALWIAVAALALPRSVFAQGTPYYFDVNNTSSGFGTPTNGAIYNQDGNYWTTDVNGVSPALAHCPVMHN